MLIKKLKIAGLLSFGPAGMELPLHNLNVLIGPNGSGTQLVVTTHSRMLVDALSQDPASVVVCHKEEGESRFERLDPAGLALWLEKYSLGELWSMGELGGNRW